MPKAPSTRRSKPKSKVDVVETDIIISIKVEHMDNIVSRTKNHEFRKYLISDKIQRMWFYVSTPDRTLRYIAEISTGKTRGQVKDEVGLGNNAFNKGLKESNYAYEILHLYRVKEPCSSVELKNKYNVSPPQMYAYVPRIMFNSVSWEDQEQLF